MKEWNDFLKKLNKYKPNTGILKLQTFINKVKNCNSQRVLYRGDYWLQFFDQNITLKYNPQTNEIVITESYNINNFTEEIIRTNYKMYFFDYIRIDTDKIVNTYLKRKNGGYYLLLEANKMREDFTKNGFQIQKKCCTQHSQNFIYVSDDFRKMFDLIVPDDYYQSGKDGRLDADGIILAKTFYHYGLSGNNWGMNAAPDELNDLIVFYATESNNYTNAMFFPAFFNETKNIIIEPFIKDKSLQFNGTQISGYILHDISYENHSIEDAEKYIQARHFYRDKILELENKTALDKVLKKLKEN